MKLDEQTIKDIDRGFRALQSIEELSQDIKAVNRSIMDENTLIGFNMAVALFNKHFAEFKEEKVE